MNGMNTENYKEIRYDDDRAKEWIYRAITELSALEQKVLALFYSKEFTISDLADRVNLSPAGVRNTLAGARNTIRILDAPVCFRILQIILSFFMITPRFIFSFYLSVRF